ncbi:MAG TPA: cyclic nucleotide-binding domain-containing protein [Rhodospirillales bacterium]
MANLAGKTYEVLTADGKRWLLESEHTTRSGALQRAEAVLAAGKHAGVRVVAESQRTGQQEVIFEELIDRASVVTIVPIEQSSHCRDLADFYRFPARRTAGRLLRNFLDDQGLTALELAFNPGQLMMFERNDKLFPPAMQRIGTIQARAAGIKPMERTDALYKAFEQIKARSREIADNEQYPALLKAKGINALIDVVTQREPEDRRETAIRGAIAGYLKEGGDWNGKLLLLVGLGRGDPKAEAVEYLDETVAEILDGAEAIKDVLGGQADAAAANRVLIHLSAGRCTPPRNPISCIIELNEMLGRLVMPLTREVLLDRVASFVGGIRPLTKEGPEAEREAFVSLVRELTVEDGILGGTTVVVALTRRGRMALSETDEDLIAEKAVDRLLDLMPNRAVRLGFLIELSRSGGAAKEAELARQAIDRVEKQLGLMASLIPDASGPEAVARVVHGLRHRLSQDDVTAEIREKLSKTLDGLVARTKGGDGKGEANGGKTSYKLDEGKKPMADPTGETRMIRAGELLFEEGEVGELAFLIISGAVEIFRKSGNQERVLATLGRGEMIGEMSLIDNQPRIASARALQDTEVRVISRDSLQQRLARLEQTDRVLRRLIAVLVSRIRGQAQSPG